MDSVTGVSLSVAEPWYDEKSNTEFSPQNFMSGIKSLTQLTAIS